MCGIKMRNAQASIEYSTILALVLIFILISLFYLGEGVIPKAMDSAKQNEIIVYQDNVESILHGLKATDSWNSLKNQTISCSNSQCTFNGETKSIDDSTFSYSETTLENAYNKCIYENDLDSCKAIVYVLGD